MHMWSQVVISYPELSNLVKSEPLNPAHGLGEAQHEHDVPLECSLARDPSAKPLLKLLLLILTGFTIIFASSKVLKWLSKKLWILSPDPCLRF
jgi:hypothetical protein